MSDQVDKLRATILELEQELRTLQAVDDETRQVLQQALREIRTVLHDEEQAAIQRQTLQDQLQSAARGFEGSHPTVTGILSRLIDGLGQMGI
jgi:chromosome segregation ATPase